MSNNKKLKEIFVHFTKTQLIYDKTWYNISEKGKGVYLLLEEEGSEKRVMYVGQTTNKDGLKKRISQYKNPDQMQKTNLKINDYIKSSNNKFYVAFFNMNDKCKAEVLRQESIVIGAILSEGYKLLNGSYCDCKECLRCETLD